VWRLGDSFSLSFYGGFGGYFKDGGVNAPVGQKTVGTVLLLQGANDFFERVAKNTTQR
jgi:hypothetical protein